ncbi:MAG TPA: Zn-ribbon domain-containing OB-fold protein [Candidatus Acidoferrales bacterium]|nr:Zn-ribbon domain-containing OB-fold protein [Candidatus Acidoferrales bacterium]
MSKQSQPNGTGLKEDDIQANRVLTVAYQPKIKYSWATGIAIGKFLSGLRQGQIIGTRCDQCGRVVVPPRIFCELCFKRTETWVKLPDTGSVNTFSISHITADTTRIKNPIIPAVIEIDGTSNAGFLHLIGDVKPDDVKIGMKVKAIWQETTKRQASITDIKYFAPIR